MDVSPFNPKLNASLEKVEKVVNPPQNPTNKKAFKRGGIISYLPNIPESKPKIKHPKIFMVNVARGKGAFQITRNNRLTKKRQQVPTKPPAPANNINFHISLNV